MNDWSIQEIAKLAGTTSRTLRHYDDIGLLTPSDIGTNGYRRYDTAALVRLQRILLLRELGLSLPQIAEIYTRVGYKAVAVECHSDNVASQAINVPLTEDRARRIKTELVRYGVPEAAVTAVGLGFSDPLVPDAPLDTAISNRRCVIALT